MLCCVTYDLTWSFQCILMIINHTLLCILMISVLLLQFLLYSGIIFFKAQLDALEHISKKLPKLVNKPLLRQFKKCSVGTSLIECFFLGWLCGWFLFFFFFCDEVNKTKFNYTTHTQLLHGMMTCWSQVNICDQRC